MSDLPFRPGFDEYTDVFGEAYRYQDGTDAILRIYSAPDTTDIVQTVNNNQALFTRLEDFGIHVVGHSAVVISPVDYVLVTDVVDGVPITAQTLPNLTTEQKQIIIDEVPKRVNYLENVIKTGDRMLDDIYGLDQIVLEDGVKPVLVDIEPLQSPPRSETGAWRFADEVAGIVSIVHSAAAIEDADFRAGLIVAANGLLRTAEVANNVVLGASARQLVIEYSLYDEPDRVDNIIDTALRGHY